MLQVEAGEAEVGLIGTATPVAGETLAASGTAITTGVMTTDQRRPLATRLKMAGGMALMAVSTAVGLTPMVAVATATMDSPTLVLRLGLKTSRISSLVPTRQEECRMAWPNHSSHLTHSNSHPSQWRSH